MPSSRSLRTSRHMRARLCGSSPVVGSSRNMTWGEWMTPGGGPIVGAAALRHEANAPPHLRGGAPQVHPGDRGVAAVRADQRGQHPERGRLAGPVGAEEAEDLTALHGEVHAADRIDIGDLAAALGPE